MKGILFLAGKFEPVGGAPKGYSVITAPFLTISPNSASFSGG
ncbi:MAG TPA: hypothetical protein VLZ07_10030 [Syntrophales bacterium]|nr:hypothetical protein [Syntrophales bacterium]